MVGNGGRVVSDLHLGEISSRGPTGLGQFMLISTFVCKISGVRSVTEFGMGQGGRGGDFHERAATIPSPAPGLEKGDRESLRLAVL